MTESLEPVPATRRESRRQIRRQRRRVSVVGVLGELLITGGLVVLLFIGWQLYISEWIVGSEERQQTSELRDEWNKEAEAAPVPDPTPTEGETAAPEPAPTPLGEDAPPVYDAPVPAVAANAARFGALIVPRWGANYSRSIAEGVGTEDVLDKGRLGRYPSTQMPGEPGNFAIAAHRMGHGGSLHYIHELQLGDHIYVETREGWYRYSFRNLEYVRPSGVGVLNQVPQDTVQTGERYITLTSCNPMHTSTERIIAYGVYDGFYPRDTSAANFGAPDEIAETVNGKA